jgi:hypothetical protein
MAYRNFGMQEYFARSTNIGKVKRWYKEGGG